MFQKMKSWIILAAIVGLSQARPEFSNTILDPNAGKIQHILHYIIKNSWDYNGYNFSLENYKFLGWASPLANSPMFVQSTTDFGYASSYSLIIIIPCMSTMHIQGLLVHIRCV